MSLFAAAVNTSGQALPRGEHYDVVVVGASLTGLVATLLLTQSGRRVALVEAGVISPSRPGGSPDANEETALASALSPPVRRCTPAPSSTPSPRRAPVASTPSTDRSSPIR